MTTIEVFVLLLSNLEWMSILRLMLQTHIDDHKNSRDKALDTSAETRKLEGKLNALVNLVTQLAVNQKPGSVTRVSDIRSCNAHQTSFSARNDAIVIRGVHDLGTDTSAETRELEGKLDALGNLVTQLAANQNPASVARVCGIRSSNDHHTSVCVSSQESGVDYHPEAYAANTYSRPPQGVHDMAKDSSAETRKLKGKLDAFVNLVTQLTANQKPTSIARVCGIYSSNDHHTSVCPSSQHTGVDEHPEPYAANTYSRPPQQVHEVATDSSTETRKLEGKLDALVNLWMSILRLMLQTPIADHHSSRDKALDREDGSQLLAVQCKK
ncbi:hypothetical protein Fmac_028544 [Flemingia macrophylla]|uniref:Uncharacterized protein n=1 Tax=Flemingia macrophylla TaxID=520843 RepID=A0ABD1L7S7_9FABA